jgi:signal transduction histidine kinase
VKLSTLISQHKHQVISRWSRKVVDRLGLEAAHRPQLINALPDFLDELVECIDEPPESWCHSEGAASHGRHRVEMGLDIGALAEEFSMVTEAILEEASSRQVAITPQDAAALTRLVGRGTAESVRAYARLRDRQLAQEAARHFSFIAHELRTPLHTARLVVHLLANDTGDRPRLLERLQQAHDQLVDLVDNSLVEARLQGERKIQLTVQHTHELMREGIANVSMLAVRRNIELTLEGDDLEIVVDRKVMVSALTNLLVNGVKFSREGGIVTIRSRSAEDRVLIEVDDGCGGLPEDLPSRLFQPFVQASSDRSGFGLGLVIVKQAVEAHEGAVRVVNLPPNGCRFVVELTATKLQPSDGASGSAATDAVQAGDEGPSR